MSEGRLPPLLVRADAGRRIGLGHVARSLTVAEAWREHGGAVEFLGEVPEGPFRRRLCDVGIAVHPASDPPGSAADLERSVRLAKELADRSGARPWALVDGYSFTAEYLRGLRGVSRTLVLDDLAALPHYDADLVLNQNPAAPELRYDCPPETVLLLGSRFALLRDEFRDAPPPRPVPPVATRLLVTLGGADPAGFTARAIEALVELPVPDLRAVVLVGPSNPHRTRLDGLAADRDDRIELRSAMPDEVAALMAHADLALTAAGSTCWELAHLGVPMLTVEVAENQRAVAGPLARAGAALSLGWHEAISPEGLRDALRLACEDQDSRQRMAEAGRRLVDGRGVERVLSVIRALEAPAIDADLLDVRPATAADLLQVWRLANDPVLRASSFGRAEIPLAEHATWFRGKLLDPDSLLLVLEIGGALVAQVRYDRRGPEELEVHFAVAPAFRGRGLGTATLARTRRMACERLGARRVRGLVLSGNVPSARAFRGAGYQLVEEREERGAACFVFQSGCDT